MAEIVSICTNKIGDCLFMYLSRSVAGAGASKGSEDPCPLIRQKRSKKGPIFHACIGPRSTIHKEDPPVKNPGYGPGYLSIYLFGYGRPTRKA